MVIDPVCKMEIEESTAVATSEYNGKKYYFCAKGCKIAFDKNPDKYVAGTEKGKGGCGCCGGGNCGE
ncbi:MAG TPA: YHS domain-containing protein [Elusimicrobia bacterium]|nr:MAG: YHS domain-containing protein [Elusimicrobia bacterium RIFOXYA12_FULL_49_49]OGS06242.1 MAG: YHS domain-containing protein [Elusimicrobia bacterium RIFOXYA1_FULL_47_7]OGS10233.1 MAG: YHS domain-containing protein [Elusimicrobia bacterium RIFOXYB1_FULL_48_9]OGS14647.1 MAG: YHS domain-containing protein [Elusimicrobia bacterium RIFOXYA2_FULL_47_53]OGS25700.1 MAG: YHS domain-containing protein [Elusimicrobia bacterium RIFOXYB12_FULL_50_12]OGS31738.1 MAG: YHS domain-containing protein [Elus